MLPRTRRRALTTPPPKRVEFVGKDSIRSLVGSSRVVSCPVVPCASVQTRRLDRRCKNSTVHDVGGLTGEASEKHMWPCADPGRKSPGRRPLAFVYRRPASDDREFSVSHQGQQARHAKHYSDQQKRRPIHGPSLETLPREGDAERCTSASRSRPPAAAPLALISRHAISVT